MLALARAGLNLEQSLVSVGVRRYGDTTFREDSVDNLCSALACYPIAVATRTRIIHFRE
ncbi:hypothetical protein D3C80_2174720 [compost metagenome]